MYVKIGGFSMTLVDYTKLINDIFYAYTRCNVVPGTGVILTEVKYDGGNVHNFERYLTNGAQPGVHLYWDSDKYEENFITLPVMFYLGNNGTSLDIVFPGCLDEDVDVNYEGIVTSLLNAISVNTVKDINLYGGGHGGDFQDIISSIPEVDTVSLIHFDVSGMSRVSTELNINCNTVYVGDKYYTSISQAVIKQYPEDEEKPKHVSAFNKAVTAMNGSEHMNSEVVKYYDAIIKLFNMIVSNRGCTDKVTEHKVNRGFILVADLSKSDGDMLFPEFSRYRNEKYMYLVFTNLIQGDYFAPGICLYVYRKGTPDTVEVILPNISAVTNNIEMLTTMTALSQNLLPIDFNLIKIIRYVGSWEGNISIILSGLEGKALDLNDLNFNQDALRIYFFADKFPNNNFIMDFERDFYMEPSTRQNKFKSVRDFRNGNAQKFDYGDEVKRTDRDIRNLHSDFGCMPTEMGVSYKDAKFNSAIGKMFGNKRGESKISSDIRNNQFNPEYLHLRYLCEGYIVYFETSDAFDIYSYFNFKRSAYDTGKHTALSDKFREVCGEYGFIAYTHNQMTLIRGLDKSGRKIEMENIDITKLTGYVYNLVDGTGYDAKIKVSFKDWGFGYYVESIKPM